MATTAVAATWNLYYCRRMQSRAQSVYAMYERDRISCHIIHCYLDWIAIHTEEMKWRRGRAEKMSRCFWPRQNGYSIRLSIQLVIRTTWTNLFLLQCFRFSFIFFLSSKIEMTHHPIAATQQVTRTQTRIRVRYVDDDDDDGTMNLRPFSQKLWQSVS